MYSTTGQEFHLVQAIELQEKMDERFEDKQGGRYWASGEDELVLVRMKESQVSARAPVDSMATVGSLTWWTSGRSRVSGRTQPLCIGTLLLGSISSISEQGGADLDE